MTRPQRERVVEHYTTESVRLTAVLRLPLIGLIILLGPIAEISHWLPVVYGSILGTYAVAALLWLLIVLRQPVRPWAAWVSTVVDVLAILALCLTSGGATSLLLPVFFLLPISVAFQLRPELTALLGTSTAFGYLSVWIVYSKRDDTMGLPNEIYLYFGFLLWLAMATTALCFVLVRRSSNVIALLDIRKRLVSESMEADERQRQELAEQLHDGPLQNLFAARLGVEEAAERNPDSALDAVDAAIQSTAAQLRSIVTALHPQVLAQLGLTEALRELVRDFERRGAFEIRAELAEVGRPEVQSLLYRVARELLSNVYKHAHATTVHIELAMSEEDLTLTVSDNGAGFDPAVLEQRITEGHIGLASVFVRVESLGGAVALSSGADGTRVSVSAPLVAGQS
ncbi:sensor histidine kinase [Antrihabitans sp. YC2-6]|uniref:sensor histidine kinase n=1 Tax=Antrihabitans sp. YC2-6 TaxID=2799498 RepID=UPI0018F6401B|nr:ATP-binding protein [Antrihabitans sp. YC2-6]MBJ8345335.1 sensor histidine kinase [Antrihabitans sp. YC2-6]